MEMARGFADSGRATALGSLLLLFLTGCAPQVTPVSRPDPEAACPGGRLAWKLEIADQRAERPDSERTTGWIRDSLSKSFPGCRWAPDSGAGSIRIEVHRLAVRREDNWEAVADWTVSARDAAGRTLTEFESTAEVSRPNYRGSNNEKEALQQAFEQAMAKTLAGLRSVPSGG